MNRARWRRMWNPWEWLKFFYENVGHKHPTLSACGLVGLFAIIGFLVWWRLDSQYQTEHPTAKQELVKAEAVAPMPIVPEDSGVSVEFKQRDGGITVEVKQTFDRLSGPPTSVGLENVFRIDGGAPATTPEFHRPDGTFMYPRCILPSAGGGDGKLYFNLPQSWWIVRNNGRGEAKIHFEWGDRPGGQIVMKPGDWEVSIVVTVGAREFIRKVRCLWTGSGVITTI